MGNALGAKKSETGPPLGRARPFAWAFYHDGTDLLTADDMASVLWGSYQPPYADGPLLWGAPGRSGGKFAQSYLGFLNATQAPLARQLMDEIAECSSKSCSGHGACSQIAPPPLGGGLCAVIDQRSGSGGGPYSPPVDAADATVDCVCDAGYSGPSCSVSETV